MRVSVTSSCFGVHRNVIYRLNPNQADMRVLHIENNLDSN
jgi:hypothetical protein